MLWLAVNLGIAHQWKHSISWPQFSPTSSNPSLSLSSSSSALSSPAIGFRAPPLTHQNLSLSTKAPSGTSAVAPSAIPSGTRSAMRFITSTTRHTRLPTTSPPTKLAKLPPPTDKCMYMLVIVTLMLNCFCLCFCQ